VTRLRRAAPIMKFKRDLLLSKTNFNSGPVPDQTLGLTKLSLSMVFVVIVPTVMVLIIVTTAVAAIVTVVVMTTPNQPHGNNQHRNDDAFFHL
jgi:hypothetical protein